MGHPPIQSHYANYVTAQDNAANNIGSALETVVSQTALDSDDTFRQWVTTQTNPKVNAILTGTAVEPCSANYSENCIFQGYINFNNSPCQ